MTTPAGSQQKIREICFPVEEWLSQQLGPEQSITGQYAELFQQVRDRFVERSPEVLTDLLGKIRSQAAPAGRQSPTLVLRAPVAPEPGASADLVLVDGDPTSQLSATLNTRAVWRRGHRLAIDASGATAD